MPEALASTGTSTTSQLTEGLGLSTSTRCTPRWSGSSRRDTGDEIVIGIVLLVLPLPGLFGLWRWARPKA